MRVIFEPAVKLKKPPAIRAAIAQDIDGIYALMKDYVAQGVLLPRSKSDICDNLMKFIVIEIDGVIVACGALEIFNANLCEIRSLVVAENQKRHGFGQILVDELINKAKSLGLKRIMALTYVPRFFHKSGFRTVPKEIFPEKVWGVCFKCCKFNDCDEIAVLKELS